ncbi:MAG: hypothetical protein CMB67_00950 [Euryarchaeota archaeon]|nr:hypothetical protein [Euryarchaeota archaeon]
MVGSDLVVWSLTGLVILAIFGYVFWDLLKRWRIGLRLAALDESLLLDDGVAVEEITDAPPGSVVVHGRVAEFLENGPGS